MAKGHKIKYVCIIVFIINLTADNLLDTKHMILKKSFYELFNQFNSFRCGDF